MSEDKLSKFEITKAFAVLAFALTVYTVVSNFVLEMVLKLGFKLLDKITSR